MRIIVDTNIFWNKNALRQLLASEQDIIVPAVVFTERARQLQTRHGTTPQQFQQLLQDLEFNIEPYTHREAQQYATQIQDDKTWQKRVRDAMIAGHVRDGDTLWTANGRDFVAVGVDEGKIVNVKRE